jgi:hypothetical protein
MAGFGKRPWGSSPFGSLRSGITGVPEVKEPTETPVFGAPSNDGTAAGPERVLSLNEFEKAIFFGDPDSRVNPHHVSAYVQSFEPDFGLPTATDNILKAKSWSAASTYVAYDQGFIADTVNLGAIVKAAGRASSDLSAYIFAYGAVYPGDPVDLPAVLQPLRLEDLPALVAAIDAVNLVGNIESIPGFNLPAQADPVASVNLPATSGAHPPEDISAFVAAHFPVELPVYIIGGFSDTLDLGAALTSSGQIADLPVFIKIALRTFENLSARVRVIGQSTKDLPAQLQPYREVDLSAFITTQRISNVLAIIKGFAPGTSDLPASIARIDSASFDMQAHTIAQFIELSDVAGKIRIIQLGNGDVPSSLTAVSPFINISKVLMNFTPLINLDADITQVGGFLPVNASITPVHHESTGLADDSGFTITASSYRFYLGTTRGVFVPPNAVPQVRVSTYTNNHDRPDLHATISAFNQTDLSAYLKVAPLSDLPATLRVIGLDHISDLVARVASLTPRDIQASIAATGVSTDIPASIATAGLVDDLNATLVPFIDPLALNVLSISTQPVANLGALINYDAYVVCAPTTFIVSLGAYIKPLVTGTPNNMSDMSATVTSSLATLDMAATLISRKRTRVRLLNLTFTAKIRGSERIRGTIVPLHHVVADLAAQITGLLHEVDLPATISPVRYQPHDVDFTAVEKVANLTTGEVKDVLVSFKSQVHHYVYEDATNAVYATDRGTWAIDVRTLARDNNFFDRSASNREHVLDDAQEFYSLDEAIRAAVVILCDRRQYNLSASITVRGAISDLSAQITTFPLERTSDLPTKLMPVVNLPDITASINTGLTSSSLAALSAAVTPSNLQALNNITGEIFGTISTNLAAEITAT